MKENKITAITKEKEEVLKDVYKDTLEILDAYDHQTLTRPEGTYYDGNETIEEVAVNMLYDMIKIRFGMIVIRKWQQSSSCCFWSGTMRCMLIEKKESVILYWLRLSL